MIILPNILDSILYRRKNIVPKIKLSVELSMSNNVNSIVSKTIFMTFYVFTQEFGELKLSMNWFGVKIVSSRRDIIQEILGNLNPRKS